MSTNNRCAPDSSSARTTRSLRLWSNLNARSSTGQLGGALYWNATRMGSAGAASSARAKPDTTSTSVAVAILDAQRALQRTEKTIGDDIGMLSRTLPIHQSTLPDQPHRIGHTSRQ